MPARTRKQYRALYLLFLLLALGGALALLAARAAARPQWPQKLDAQVLGSTLAGESPQFLLVLKEQANLNALPSLGSKEAKGEAVYRRLTEVALRTQAPIIAVLEEADAAYRPFWISNMILVQGDAQLVEALARRPDVARLHANPWTKLDTVVWPSAQDNAANQTAAEWNIDLVNAPDVWAQGVSGVGITVAGQDTGYDWRHPALKDKYRGWDGQEADHTYNWHDAVHEENPNTAPGNPCGFDSPQPCDDDGHGTHTMGTMIGEDGPQNRIGMAPGAQWIACRNMEQGWGTPATYAECYEWFVAPYPQNGDPFKDGNPQKAPHVINNSWSCPASEGCSDPDILRNVVNNVRAAGIVTVHSAGNNGPSCGSVSSPAANYDASFTVGATNSSDFIAGFSSRGPSPQGSGLLLKPDISAPGVSVRSSFPGDDYGTLSGTSMAAPHVAGLVALLIAARPDLSGEVAQLEKLIQDTAVIQYSSEGCGGDGPQTVPNHTFGWGRIDAFAAYKAALEPPATPTPAVTPTVTAAGTATATMTPTNTASSTPIPPVTGTPQATAPAPVQGTRTFIPLWLAR